MSAEIANEETSYCPKCGSEFRYAPSISAYRIACEKCSHEFAVPPLPVPPSPVQPSPSEPPRTTKGQSSKAAYLTYLQTKLKSNRISTIIAFIMLGCTVLLPFAMAAVFVFSSISVARENSKTKGIPLGPYGDRLEFGPGGFAGSTSSQREAKQAGQTLGILFASMCCPFMPYSLIMLVLGIAYFAFRSSNN